MCPWNLLSSSNKFTSYLSAYSVFLSSIAGVMITDYYIIRRGHYRLSDLYTTERSGWYWYTYGINFRAYAAYISGILINVVGFAGASESQEPAGNELWLIRKHSWSHRTTRCNSSLPNVLFHWIRYSGYAFPTCSQS